MMLKAYVNCQARIQGGVINRVRWYQTGMIVAGTLLMTNGVTLFQLAGLAVTSLPVSSC